MEKSWSTVAIEWVPVREVSAKRKTSSTKRVREMKVSLVVTGMGVQLLSLVCRWTSKDKSFMPSTISGNENECPVVKFNL